MNTVVRIGVIGTGFARNVQIPAFQKCESAEIVSVASGSLENAESTAKDFGIGHFTADWRETVSRDDIDLICITTPPKLHREMTLFAIERGKNILCEKPMAMNVEEARQMSEAAKSANVLALIDHELRFQPGRLHAHGMLRNGVIGKVRHAKYHFQAPHRGDPTLPWNWWSDAEEGGGALGAIGSHIFDSFHWFLGTTAKSVYCQLQTHVKERRHPGGETLRVTSDDESLLLLRFKDSELTEDATGIISVSMTEFPQYRNRIEIYGSKGAIAVDACGEVYFAKAGETEWREVGIDSGTPIPGVPNTGFSSGFTEFAPKIIGAVRDRRTAIEHGPTFDDGVTIQVALDAARESNACGCAVELGNLSEAVK